MTNAMALYSEVVKIFEQDLYDTIIPQDSLIIKLQKEQKTVVAHAGWKKSALAYCNLAKEILEKSKKTTNE